MRNEELEGMLQSMRDLERTWNHKFNYPWTFFNDVPFNEEFKRKTRAATNAECRYGMLVPCKARQPRSNRSVLRGDPQGALESAVLDQ